LLAQLIEGKAAAPRRKARDFLDLKIVG
jgi:hypothetical protein